VSASAGHKRRTRPAMETTRKRAISTFSTSQFCACIRDAKGRRANVYKALERTSTRAEGEMGRAKSGTLKKQILIGLE